jgi:hypothetical protein
MHVDTEVLLLGCCDFPMKYRRGEVGSQRPKPASKSWFLERHLVSHLSTIIRHKGLIGSHCPLLLITRACRGHISAQLLIVRACRGHTSPQLLIVRVCRGYTSSCLSLLITRAWRGCIRCGIMSGHAGSPGRRMGRRPAGRMRCSTAPTEPN